MKNIDSDSVLIAVDEKADSYKFYDNSEKLDQRLKVLAISDVQAYPNVEFIADESLAPGMLFGKHPYLANTYVDLNIYEDNIFKYTQLKIREIAFLLGVKKVDFSVKVLQCLKSDKNLHIEGNSKGVKGDLQVKKTEEKKLTNRYSKSFEFEGEANADTYVKAKQLAEESGLFNKVEDIEELIKYHDPSLPVREKKRTINIQIAKEYNSRLDIAATAECLGQKIFSIKADYQSKFKTYNEYVYNVQLEW